MNPRLQRNLTFPVHVHFFCTLRPPKKDLVKTSSMTQNSTLSKFYPAILFTLITVVLSFPVMAQQDDPNLDQIPFSLRNKRIVTNGDLPLSSVITVNNWDNFNLAVDFAENNMAENPSQPSWYFTAYNTNAAHHSEDGLTWANSVPSFGQSMQGDPVVAYDSLGNLFYENMYGSSSIVGCMVLKSTNNGSTWNPAVTAIAGNDKNWIACDQTSGPYANYIYTTMTNGGAGNFARSTDHGATFQSTFAPTTQSLPGMMVAVGPNGATQGGSVYVVTNSGSSFASTYTFYRSTNGGANFTQMSAQTFSGYVGSNVGGRNSVQNMRTRPYPMIAADNSYGPNRGRLYCVYASNNPPGDGNKPDIWCRYSDNGGTTWSSAIQVNDDVNTTTHHQWHPAIWCDKPTGRLYAMWMDTRDCATNDSALIYASYSDNGGVTWAANQALSNQKMKIDCPTCGGGGTPRYQGDYNGIISNKKVAQAGWTDFRQGSFISMTAYFPDFAMSVNHTSDTLFTPTDSTDFTISVPSVKLYSDTVVLSAQITPSPAPGTITFSYPQGNLITAFPGSKIIRAKLNGAVPHADYQVTFFAKGPNGTPAHQRNATIKVMGVLPLSSTVTANPAVVCTGGNTQLQASVTGGITPYNYAWTSTPAGFTSSLPNPVASPTVNTWYKCTVHDNASTIEKDSIYVTIGATPVTPGTISGNIAPCEGATMAYNIATVTGATIYTWSVPLGSTILSGQGTNAITVVIGQNSGNISVTAGNTCGTSPESQLTITVSPLPANPGIITGPNSACDNTTQSYSVVSVAGLTYNWTVPAGSTITSGQGTADITVLLGTVSGTISVNAVNTCGNSSPGTLLVTVEIIPGAAQAISGSDTVCAGETGYQYSVPIISNATSYAWILPTGASVVSGGGTSAIVVSFDVSAVSGNISAAGINMCGTGTESEKYVNVVVCTGINSNSLQSRILVYPNPVHDLLTISFKDAQKHLRIRITDMKGQTVYDQSYSNLSKDYDHQINVNGFAKGVYMLHLTNDSGVFNGKVLVE